jgi:hypothetical protein
MPDSRSVSTGKTWGVVKLFAACCLSALLLGSSCPSPEPFPSPPLQAPVFTGADLAVGRFDTYRPAIHLAWTSPRNDSVPTREFVILQKSIDSSGFFVLVRSIPDSVRDYYANLDRFTFPQAPDVFTLQYRIFGIDSLGRPGDTSAIESVAVAWPPMLLWPAENDSVGPDSLVWSVFGVMMGYFSYAYIYGDTAGFLWKSPTPDTPTYSTESHPVRHTVRLPASPALVAGHDYFWAVKVEIPSARASSIAVGRFYVR